LLEGAQALRTQLHRVRCIRKTRPPRAPPSPPQNIATAGAAETLETVLHAVGTADSKLQVTGAAEIAQEGQPKKGCGCKATLAETAESAAGRPFADGECSRDAGASPGSRGTCSTEAASGDRSQVARGYPTLPQPPPPSPSPVRSQPDGARRTC